MTIREHLILWLGALAVVSMAGFARAQEPCTSPQQVAETEEASGGIIAGVAHYDGSVTDEMLIVESGGIILLYGFKDSCLVGMQAIEPARDKGSPA